MPVVLEPVSPELARALVGGDLSAVRAGEGWPHADTIDGLRMVERGSAAWLVLLDGLVIGDCGTVGAPTSAGDQEIGYGLAAPYRGRGHGTEVVRTLTDLLLASPEIRRVTAEVARDNVPSRRVLERNGFAVEESDDEHVRYARAQT